MDPNAPNAGSTANSQTGDLQGTAASIVQDVLTRAQSAGTDTERKVTPVVTRVPPAAHAPLYRAVHEASGAVTSSEEASDSGLAGVTQYVKANPRRSLAIAFIAGWLAARIVF